MTTLPLTTTERLLAVADVIETHPAQYRQRTWYDDDFVCSGDPRVVHGRGYQCDTTACIAGWAVALTPAEFQLPEPNEASEYWTDAGATVLGISGALARHLFNGGLRASAATVADILRRLATLPEDQRTIADALPVFTGEQLNLIYGHTVCSTVAPDEDDELPDEEDEDEDDEEEYVLDDVLVGAG